MIIQLRTNTTHHNQEPCRTGAFGTGGIARARASGTDFPRTETLSMFLAQALSTDRSCQQAVNASAVKRLAGGLPHCSTHTGGYRRARQRLPAGAELQAHAASAYTRQFWFGVSGCRSLVMIQQRDIGCSAGTSPPLSRGRGQALALRFRQVF